MSDGSDGSAQIKLDDQLARLQPQRIFKVWQWIVGWIVVVVIVTTLVLVVINVLETRAQSLKNSDVDCARQVASDYEDARDEIFRALNTNRATFGQAVDAFNAFEMHNGKPESRAKRTTRLCG